MVRKRTLARRRKREVIINSRAYKEWWRARRTQSPVPSNPYQAYMTDVHMFAQLRDREYWQERTNWSDIPTVDFPPTARIPKSRGRPRRPTIKEERRRRKPRREPKPKAPSVMQRFADELTERFHLPHVEVVARPERGPLKSQWRTFFKWDPTTYSFKRFSQVIIGTLGAPKENPLQSIQVLTAMKHELGHHLDVFKTWVKTGAINPEYALRGTVETELEAWRHAEPLPNPLAVSKWFKRYALATYRHQIRGRGPVRHVGVVETKPLGEELGMRDLPAQRL